MDIKINTWAIFCSFKRFHVSVGVRIIWNTSNELGKYFIQCHYQPICVKREVRNHYLLFWRLKKVAIFNAYLHYNAIWNLKCHHAKILVDLSKKLTCLIMTLTSCWWQCRKGLIKCVDLIMCAKCGLLHYIFLYNCNYTQTTKILKQRNVK